MIYGEVNNELVINDLSSADIESGFFSISFTLDDGYNQVTESVILTVSDPPALEETEPELEPEVEE